ncbi:MAG TPA: PAS domain-containing protein [Opitutaceae bacterium]|nr:PAS domain-containing protein [Opitutaceae bacterium]
MKTHGHLHRQIEEHLGAAPRLSPKLVRLLESIDAVYRLFVPESVAGIASGSDTQFGRVFEAIAEGVVVRANDGRIVAHNSAAERLLGLSAAQMRGEEAHDPRWRLVDEQGRDLPLEHIPSLRTIRDGKARQRVLLGVTSPSEGQRWLSVSAMPLHDSDGAIIAAAATLVDVTDLADRIPPPMLATESLPREDRPTMSTIAKALGVSAATVSMALRQHPRISAAMQARVRRVAEQLGYRPDPRLRRAMALLRKGGKATFQSTVCALADPESFRSPYVETMVAAARERADRLGYGFTLELLDRRKLDGARLRRKLFHCGIEGVLLLPLGTPWNAVEFLEWNRLAVVACGYAVHTPNFDRVASHWFAGVHGVYAELAARGYRRIGAVIDRRFDELVNYRVTGAVASAPLHLPVATIEPFYHCGLSGGDARCARSRQIPSRPFCGRFVEWFAQERPDALVFSCETDATAALAALQPDTSEAVGVAVLARAPGSSFAGWEERPAEIGAMAVDWLDQKIRARELGVPIAPSKRLVLGAWREGTTVRQQASDASSRGGRSPSVCRAKCCDGVVPPV